MKNCTKLALLSASLLLAGNTIAAEPGAGSVSSSITGSVPLVCEITTPESIDFDFGDGLVANAQSDVFDIYSTCNSKGGASFTLTSGVGLNDGSEGTEHYIPYAAHWYLDGTVQSASTVLHTQSNGLQEDGFTIGKSLALAHTVHGQFKVQILQDAYFAGTYSDSITLTLAAR